MEPLAEEIKGAKFLASLRKPSVPTEQKSATDFQWSPVPASEFFTADYRQEWLCKGVLVNRQPAVLGGPQKTLKTTIGLDLALSLASGTAHLGKFSVPQRRRVAFMSAESGGASLQRAAKAICYAKGVQPDSLDGWFSVHFALPQLSHPAQVARLHEGLKNDRIEVVFLDPLYLALLAGAPGTAAKAENLYEIGPLLLSVAQACLNAGSTPCLMHHSKKGSGREQEPLDLTDLAFSGIAEFARQWILLSRRKPYDNAGTDRVHELWMVTGGSAGHGGLYDLCINEGPRLNDEFTGQVWKVNVGTPGDAKDRDRQDAQEKKAREQDETNRRHEGLLLKSLDAIDMTRDGASKNQVQGRSGLNPKYFNAAVWRLVDQKIIEEVQVQVSAGGKNKETKKMVDGIRRPPLGDSGVLPN